jgi:dipeptidyl aminopeptidase/acylaminoacyl peptidase
MFHNLLTDLGYTVLDIDYRGSDGYAILEPEFTDLWVVKICRTKLMVKNTW